MVQIFNLCFRANRCNSGRRAMEPSSLMISQRMPMGRRPASLTKSTAASVCPARCKTPPGLARKRKDMARLDQILRHGRRLGHDLDGQRAVGGADAGGHAARGIHADLEIGAETLAVLRAPSVRCPVVCRRSEVVGTQINPRP